MRQMLGTYRTPQAVKAALGFEEDPDYNYARKRADAELRV